ncbi:MAG: YggS family pyridoxal phosphate-dependent enzyme [Pirellula sp.]
MERDQLEKNLAIVRQQMADACRKSGRSTEEVRLIAVTKTVGPQTCNDLISLGCRELAENRPQVLWEKSAVVDPCVLWHFIGHLQRNKSARTLPLLNTFHALDSLRLAEQLAKDATGTTANKSVGKLRVLLELNITQDQTKTGLSPNDAQELLRRYIETPSLQDGLDLCGLMGMSSLGGDDAQTHREFETLRTLRDRWQSEYGIGLRELSMGMSDDFQIAIEEGSTMVRIGSLLYQDQQS